ncbi:DNA cytosine methyltransferase [Schleiferilactobacillus shenzhenensis]|uniref:Cytosine-specific methyltransferase n=1 Tax=Schleiferilactobacillus shenzhenensis LY-73 TaxID=1231336 RepID=U4TR91_9LACO|nr:DNA cytosine methyltransferase [Schleiferilactobacillus shenzhenensis]ERL64027.1 DNA (cytosine-5-)-methyltransferase [Schleiferilactobacillus shenzhenensis LY-73]
MLKILELFGGIGSPRIALRNLGIPVKSIDYVEIDENAVRSYNAMFASDEKYQAQNVIGYDLKPDILIHGSPCQDISVAGRRLGADEGSGTRSSLMWQTLKIIEQMGLWRPRIVIWENVKGVLQKHMAKNYQRYCDVLEGLGYTTSHAVLDARDFGLPQYRERVFTISILGGQSFDFDRLRHTDMRPIGEYLERASPEYTITVPSMLSRLPGGSAGPFAGRLKPIEDWAWTITTRQTRCPNSGVVPLSDGRYRLLTPKECWLLQGYSDWDYTAAASVNGKTALYKQAGNSIPVPIFEEIFRHLI